MLLFLKLGQKKRSECQNQRLSQFTKSYAAQQIADEAILIKTVNPSARLLPRQPHLSNSMYDSLQQGVIPFLLNPATNTLLQAIVVPPEQGETTVR